MRIIGEKCLPFVVICPPWLAEVRQAFSVTIHRHATLGTPLGKPILLSDKCLQARVQNNKSGGTGVHGSTRVVVYSRRTPPSAVRTWVNVMSVRPIYHLIQLDFDGRYALCSGWNRHKILSLSLKTTLWLREKTYLILLTFGYNLQKTVTKNIFYRPTYIHI